LEEVLVIPEAPPPPSKRKEEGQEKASEIGSEEEMKRNAILLLLGILFLTFQTTLLSYLPIQRIRPDIVLVLILYWGFTLPPVSGGIHALFGISHGSLL
jgi:hypothetical protein